MPGVHQINQKKNLILGVHPVNLKLNPMLGEVLMKQVRLKITILGNNQQIKKILAHGDNSNLHKKVLIHGIQTLQSHKRISKMAIRANQNPKKQSKKHQNPQSPNLKVTGVKTKVTTIKLFKNQK